MNEYRAEVRVTPRQGLLDPQGHAIEGALRSLDFAEVLSVRVGRLIRLRLRAASPDEAHARVNEMCRQLLANPVTEDYDIRIEAEAG